MNCSSLTGLTLHNGITSISTNAFSGCSSLTDLTLPNGITSIGPSAFYNCMGLTSITILATTPPTMSSGAFTNTNDCPIYIPTGTLAAYSAATNWSAYISRFVEA